MRRFWFVASLVLAAGCWLAAGSGGVPIYASLVCRQMDMQMQMHMHHHHGSPTGSCVCDQMGGGPDLALSAALPAPLPNGPVIAAATVVRSEPAPFPLPPSSFPAPPTPPPNAALVV